MFSPSLGMRFAIGNNSPYAINASVGYSFQRVNPIYYYDNWLNKNGACYTIENVKNNNDDVFIEVDGSQISGGFTLRLGFEFRRVAVKKIYNYMSSRGSFDVKSSFLLVKHYDS